MWPCRLTIVSLVASTKNTPWPLSVNSWPSMNSIQLPWVSTVRPAGPSTKVPGPEMFSSIDRPLSTFVIRTTSRPVPRSRVGFPSRSKNVVL